METDKVLPDLLHPVLCILDRLDLCCLLFLDWHYKNLVFLLHLRPLLLFLFLLFLLLLLLLVVRSHLSLGLLEPIFSSDHGIRAFEEGNVIFFVFVRRGLLLLFLTFLLLVFFALFQQIIDEFRILGIDFLEFLVHGVEGSCGVFFHLFAGLCIFAEFVDFVFDSFEAAQEEGGVPFFLNEFG